MALFASGKTALITGGASGVGLAVAKLCRKHGMNLALVDNNKDNLAKAAEALKGSAQTETYPMDVTSTSAWTELRSKVKSNFPQGIDFLMLNAAIGPRGTWGDDDYFRKILETNLFGVVNGLNTFVQDFQSRKEPGAIVLTGSKQGITNPPGNPAYNASKAAIKSLAEHLSYDFKDSPVKVHLLVPGWTFTGLTGGGVGTDKQKPDGAWYPEQVADYLKSKMDAGQFWVICPDDDVTESMDRKRMMWSAGDSVNGRLPLSRWREEYKTEAQEWMDKQDL